MKRAKTQNKFVLFLSVLLGAVFAFSIGITFAANMQLIYGTAPKSTTAYLSNQQYQVVNSTTNAPILYSVGVHSSEIALQYSYGYNFDLRIKYSLDWLGDTTQNQLSTYNVELLFANRDNVIVDENYIYFINYKTEEIVDEETGNTSMVKMPSGLSAGNGKLSLITGVEIIETNNDEYLGKTLSISIDEVKIYKESDSYSTSHSLYDDAYTEVTTIVGEDEETERVYSEAAKAWLRHKQSSSYKKAYVMMYNYRYTNAVGVSYPGHDSAYKQKEGSSDGTWLGGNRAYAGIGIYIITGNSAMSLTAKVTGTWRTSALATNAQYDNNILFNYDSNWQVGADGNITYNYIIPANSACYINMVDSIEITSLGIISYNDKDTYKLVVRNISINNSALSFSYDTITGVYKITSGELNEVNISESDTRETYKQDDVTILNAGEYANNLFVYNYSAQSQVYHNSTIMLFNNTNVEKQVKLNYNLNYFVSNGSQALKYTVTQGEGDNKTTIEKVATSFEDPAYYRYEGLDNDGIVDKNDDLTEPSKNVFVIAPNSGIVVPGFYQVNSTFQSNVESLLSVTNEHYDIWVVFKASLAESNDNISSKNLAIEIDTSGSSGVVRVKNNTNSIVSQIDMNITLYSYKFEIADSAISAQPDNWHVTFWRYYYVDPQSGEMVQNETIDVDVNFEDEIFFYTSYAEYLITLTKNNNLTFSGNSVTGLSLKPNESVDIYTFVKDSNAQYYISGVAEASVSTANDVVLVKDNVNQKYIVNYSSSESYYVRFNGTLPDNINLGVDVITEDDGLNYFITVVRPGQIFKVVSDTTAINFIPCEDLYVTGVKGSLKSWVTESEDLSNVISAFDNYFS